MPCSLLRRSTWPAMRPRRPSAKLLPSMMLAVMCCLILGAEVELAAAIGNAGALVYGFALKMGSEIAVPGQKAQPEGSVRAWQTKKGPPKHLCSGGPGECRSTALLRAWGTSGQHNTP